MNAIQQRIIDAYNATEPLTAELALAAADEIGRLEQRCEQLSNSFWQIKAERDFLQSSVQKGNKDVH